MEFKNLLADERAVSPVIGVILMVAITVILAAVIGTFVLGLGNNLQETSPNANFQFDYSLNDDGTGTYTVTATHQGGETINSDNSNSLELVAFNPDGSREATQAFGVASNSVSSGDSAQLPAVTAGNTVRVIWTSPEGSNSQALANGQAPN